MNKIMFGKLLHSNLNLLRDLQHLNYVIGRKFDTWIISIKNINKNFRNVQHLFEINEDIRWDADGDWPIIYVDKRS